MRILGLIGGIGSGKSFVASLFQKNGAEILDADKLGHAALEQNEVKAAAKSRWGNDVFVQNGHLDRKKLAKIVFAQTEQGHSDLAFWKSVTHPIISCEMGRLIDEYREKQCRLLIVDAPLLLESGWDRHVQGVIFVSASDATRLSRVQQRGWTETEWRDREAAQFSIAQKESRATWIIQNDGSAKETEEQVNNITFFNSPVDKSEKN
ncbi:MAG: dephospho-CoA kinase [Thermoguttaceae bacterium]